MSLLYVFFFWQLLYVCYMSVIYIFGPFIEKANIKNLLIAWQYNLVFIYASDHTLPLIYLFILSNSLFKDLRSY